MDPERAQLPESPRCLPDKEPHCIEQRVCQPAAESGSLCHNSLEARCDACRSTTWSCESTRCIERQRFCHDGSGQRTSSTHETVIQLMFCSRGSPGGVSGSHCDQWVSKHTIPLRILSRLLQNTVSLHKYGKWHCLYVECAASGLTRSCAASFAGCQPGLNDSPRQYYSASTA